MNGREVVLRFRIHEGENAEEFLESLMRMADADGSIFRAYEWMEVETQTEEVDVVTMKKIKTIEPGSKRKNK